MRIFLAILFGLALATRNTWEGQFPIGRSGSCTVTLPDGKLWVFGGTTKVDGALSYSTVFNI